LESTIKNIEALLVTQPVTPASISFLSIYNAAQMMHAKGEYLAFRNGSGARFIIQQGQVSLPTNNLSAIDAYIGLTNN
jgi:hypothetical protein